MTRFTHAVAFAALALSLHRAHGQSPQEPGCNGTPLAGTVRDSTLALVPGAAITLDGHTTTEAGPDGRFRFACVAAGSHELTTKVDGFATLTMKLTAPRTKDLDLRLQAGAEVSITVEGDNDDEAQPLGGVNGTTLQGKQLQALADDPDDLQRELQQLAAAGGGNPANATISVDGFQDDSKLPPKSSIAFIKVNPDLFSAEYLQPPFEGGRIEVYTKPGAKAFHGALFTTYSGSDLNARDPFSIASAPIGKQRYGFEFNGPVRKQGSNFSMTLEHRSIDNFAVVNAITPGPNGTQIATVANVATPQRLWVGTSRLDWQLGPRNIAFISYSANVNHLSNVGVGGISLAETGYDSSTYQHAIRASNVTTISAKLMHEARLSVSFRGETDIPNSSAPSISVEGAFTGGGATLGNQRIRDLRSELDDDILLTAGKHTLKAGTQLFLYREHLTLTTNFNGTYIFTSLAQYASRTPTEFSGVTGNPQLDFTRFNGILFAQDDWKLRDNLTLSFGLRFHAQNEPLVPAGVLPRFGVIWSPDKKKTWSFNAHLGLFNGQDNSSEYAELLREDGVARITSLAYNPVYGSPFSNGATTIQSKRTLQPGFKVTQYLLANLGVAKDLGQGWNISGSIIGARIWNDGQSVNINTPLNGQPTGPRPIAANLNIYQAQGTGIGSGDVEFVGLSNSKLKRVQFFMGAVRQNIRDTTNDDLYSSPQSSTSNAGEFSRRTGNSLWQTFGNTTFKLPYKVQLSTNFYANGNAPYNIITGIDSNGDGNFNDRPQLAAPGTPGSVQTKYGLLVASGGIGPIQRNVASLPWSVHLDGNLQRAFVLTRNAKAEHQQTLTANMRSSNLINHTNVTSVGNVFNSPLFGVPYAADNGRRLEFGLRYSF